MDTENTKPINKMTVTTAELKELLSCGRDTALKIGNSAGAKITVDRRVLWNVGKVKAYIDQISKGEEPEPKTDSENGTK